MRLPMILLPLMLSGAAPAADQPKPVPTPERPHITLTWSTASEMDNYGFYVMRGDEEKGPFKALNEKILPGGGNSDLPLEYKYADENVVMGKIYWYYLESVSTAGVKEKFSPTLKKQCCKQGDVAKPAEPKKPEAAGTPAAAPEPRPRS